MRRILSLLTALSILLCCISASGISAGAAEKEIALTAENVSEADFNSDLDDDVTAADATLIRRFDCGMTDLSYTAAAASDADNDGDVTVIDATWIQRWELKMNAPEAIGETFVIRAGDYYMPYYT